MSDLQLMLIVATQGLALAAFIWLIVSTRGSAGKKKQAITPDVGKASEVEVEHIFNDEFREELRNRGRLHFEKIIGENAMFLQQDLRLTTSQLNEYMKQEITRTLQEEFAKYERSIEDAKQLAIESISRTQAAIEQQRGILEEQLHTEVAAEKERIIKNFEMNMADIVNHYVIAAIGNQIDLTDQLDFILGDLEQNKSAILEDVKSGA
jgi:hypothetical protein